MDIKKCYYCGDDAETKDHIIPISYYYSGKREGRHLTAKYGKENLIDCCKECNSLASNKVFNNVEAKKEYIQDKIWNKYKKIINMPEWTDEELNELEGYLRKSIKIKILARRWILNRVNYPIELYPVNQFNRDIKVFLEKEF